MLRVFFGLFSNDTTADWWKLYDPTVSDNTLPQFGWGKAYTLDSHSVIPTKRHFPNYNSLSTVFDEYIDLYHSVIDPQSAELFAQFTNQIGVTTPYPIAPSSIIADPKNTLEVDGELAEWLQPTRLLSEVYPPITSPYCIEDYVVVNETMENDPSLTVTGYYSFALAVKSGTTYGIATDPCIVPYNAVTDTIRIMYFVPAGTVTKVVVYRALVAASTVPQKFLNWPQWENWRLEHNHLPIVELTVGGAAYTWQTSSAAYCNTTTYPNPTPTKTNFCKFKPLNNALARMNLVWQRRINANYKMMIINTDAWTYYVGYLTKRSACFETGVGVSGDKAAQFTLAITAHGSCTLDALTAPQTSGNFTAVTRTL